MFLIKKYIGCGCFIKLTGVTSNLTALTENSTVIYASFNEVSRVKVFIHLGYQKTGLIKSNSPQPEEILGMKKASDIQEHFEHAVENGETLKGKIYPPYF